MCGIAGILLKPNNVLPNIEGHLNCMAKRMAHRGPDDQGVYVSSNGRLGLVNRRLAIRDLSSAGHMPMRNADGNVIITYNGEIYNADELRQELEREGFTFFSNSDTEVILHGYEAWGTAVIPRLRGMFALAIYDQRQEMSQAHVVLARDHLGVKPLYYAETETAVLFASEIKVLLASGLVRREINPTGLVGYLQLGSVPNPLTIYADIQAMPPATFLHFAVENVANIRPLPYYQLPHDEVVIDYPTAVAQVRQKLEQAVSSRLVSDVPLGAFLSGGLDSSGVVALMRQATGSEIRTCSMVFEEASYSEANYAKMMAASVGSNHYERVVTADDLTAEFDNILAAMDQPTIDGVNSYFVSQTARQAGLTVALSGLGGDELFGGYPNSFRHAPLLAQASRWVQVVPGGAGLAKAVLALPPNRHQFQRIQEALSQPASLAAAYVARRGLFTAAETQALLAPDLWQAGKLFDSVAHVELQAGLSPTVSAFRLPSSTFSWISRAELRSYTHQQLLRDTDVMSMAHSLEVRVPLLDVDLVALVLGLPTAVKTQQANGHAVPKPLFAAALNDLLPSTISQRREKQGFTFPFDVWLRGPLRQRSRMMLQMACDKGWVQPKAVAGVVDDFENGRLHWSRLWAVIALASLSH